MRALFLILMVAFSFSTNAQSVTGLWYTVDDEDGKPKSHIEIYEEGGVLKGKVVKLLAAATTKVCNCKGDLKGKKIEGLVILDKMQKVDDQTYEDGEILNPKNGKVYSCNISMESDDKLKVRGYLGFSLLGRTQYWYRVK